LAVGLHLAYRCLCGGKSTNFLGFGLVRGFGFVSGEGAALWLMGGALRPCWWRGFRPRGGRFAPRIFAGRVGSPGIFNAWLPSLTPNGVGRFGCSPGVRLCGLTQDARATFRCVLVCSGVRVCFGRVRLFGWWGLRHDGEVAGVCGRAGVALLLGLLRGGLALQAFSLPGYLL